MKLTPLAGVARSAFRFSSARWLVVCLVVCPAGCVDIDGGSIEASWIVNTARGGKRIDCTCARFGAVRYEVVESETGARPCDTLSVAGNHRCEFDCLAGVGTTDFAIPPGQYAINIVPLDLEGKLLGPSDGVAVPAPTNRAVRRGEVTNLGVHLIAAEEARLAGPSACEPDVLTP